VKEANAHDFCGNWFFTRQQAGHLDQGIACMRAFETRVQVFFDLVKLVVAEEIYIPFRRGFVRSWGPTLDETGLIAANKKSQRQNANKPENLTHSLTVFHLSYEYDIFQLLPIIKVRSRTF
jgi:hypothetical protein